MELTPALNSMDPKEPKVRVGLRRVLLKSWSACLSSDEEGVGGVGAGTTLRVKALR